MSDTYSYVKLRKNFGRQPMFCETPTQLLDTIPPDPKIQKQYILRNPVHQPSQCYTPKFEHHINTTRVEYADAGVNHAEGGWPKEINFSDEEATTRLRRRVERDDNYIEAVLGAAPTFSHYIKQNNAIEMYQMYFKGMTDQPPLEKNTVKVNNVYRDPSERPISSIGWTYEDDAKLVVAYCNRKYPITGPVNTNFTCFIWDIENPYVPLCEFHPPSACWQVACSPIQPHTIIAGLNDGRVCIFDIRAGTQPVKMSPAYLAHRDPVTSVIYINSRLMTEFFSGSTDGKCMWWDIRNIEMPTEELLMCINVPPGEPRNMAYADGVTSMQFDKSFPTRFLCGTETGYLINVNRKGKSPQEVFSGIFQAHNGPVKSVQRSPTVSKMFVSCGDYSVHVWSDDVHQSPMVTGMAQRHPINDVCWSPQRVSSYMCISDNGKFQIWDFLRKYREPVVVVPIAHCPLLRVKPHDEGRLVAIGDIRGRLHILSLSEGLVMSGDKDKQLMTQVYERESRREHILEARVKEIKLKLLQDAAGPEKEEVTDDEAAIRVAEDEYRKAVINEIRRTGYTPGIGSAGKASKAARKR